MLHAQVASTIPPIGAKRRASTPLTRRDALGAAALAAGAAAAASRAGGAAPPPDPTPDLHSESALQSRHGLDRPAGLPASPLSSEAGAPHRTWRAEYLALTAPGGSLEQASGLERETPLNAAGRASVELAWEWVCERLFTLLDRIDRAPALDHAGALIQAELIAAAARARECVDASPAAALSALVINFPGKPPAQEIPTLDPISPVALAKARAGGRNPTA
jgi:hypothetical protein